MDEYIKNTLFYYKRKLEKLLQSIVRDKHKSTNNAQK